MNPLYIEMENFMGHRLSKIDLSPFRSALVVAKNKNNERESNGIGKTTIFSAMEYALYGASPASKLEKIIRDGTSKCSVVFVFSLGNETYRIERSRSKSGRADVVLRQMDSQGWTKISGTRGAEVEKKIFETIRLSYKAFTHSIKFGQADLSGIAAAKSAEDRRKIIQEPMQLSDYAKLHKISVDKMRAVKRKIDKTEGAISSIGDPAADIQASELELTYCSTRIQNKESSAKSLQASIKDRQAILDEITRSLPLSENETQTKIDSLTKRSKELKTQIAAANDRVQNSSSIIDESAKKCAKLKDRKLAIVDIKESFQKDPQREAAVVLVDINKTVDDELFGTKLLARLEAEYDQASKSVPDGNICPHCFQTITDEHRNQCKAEAEKILAKKSEEIKKTKTNLTKCSNKKRKLQDEYKLCQTREQQLNELSHELGRIDSELDLLVKSSQEAEERLSKAANEMEAAQAEAEDVSKNLAALKSSEQSEDSKRVTEIKKEINVFEHGLEAVSKELAELQRRHGAAQHKQKVATQTAVKLEGLKNELTELIHKLKIHECVVESFSASGIPNFVILNVLDELKLEANQWLQKLRPDLDLDCNKELEMTYRVHGQEREYELLSGGQKVYVALSLKLGLARVIQKKLGIDIRFLLLDEVDQSLDEAGVEALVEVIKRLQDEMKVFVITHNNSLKDKFTHAILVEGDGNNGATSSVVTSW